MLAIEMVPRCYFILRPGCSTVWWDRNLGREACKERTARKILAKDPKLVPPQTGRREIVAGSLHDDPHSGKFRHDFKARPGALDPLPQSPAIIQPCGRGFVGELACLGF